MGDKENIEDAIAQIDFFKEISETIGKSSELLFLQVLISNANNEPRENIIKLLNECLGIHIENSKKLSAG